jgi:hypothetical protein
MPVICRDKVGIGIACRYIGKRSSWIAMEGQLVRPRCDDCLNQKARDRALRRPRLRIPPSIVQSLPTKIDSLLSFSCNSSLHRVDPPPAGAKVRRIASTNSDRDTQAEADSFSECGSEEQTCVPLLLFLSASCLPLCSARMAYRNAFDPSATWLPLFFFFKSTHM